MRSFRQSSRAAVRGVQAQQDSPCIPAPPNARGRAVGTIFLMTAHRKSATRCCGTHARMSAAWSARGSAPSGAGPPPGCAWLAPAQHGAAVHRLGMLPRVSVPAWLPGFCIGSRPGPSRPQPAPALARGLCSDEACVRGPTQPSRPATPDGAQRGGSARPGSCVSASAAPPLRAWLSLSGAGAWPCEALWLRSREHLLPWPQPRPGACAAGLLGCDQPHGGPGASWLGSRRRRCRGRGPSAASDPRSSDEAGPMRPSPLAHARPAPALPASPSGRRMLPGSSAAAAAGAAAAASAGPAAAAAPRRRQAGRGQYCSSSLPKGHLWLRPGARSTAGPSSVQLSMEPCCVLSGPALGAEVWLAHHNEARRQWRSP
jgi:hypothetical protein